MFPFVNSVFSWYLRKRYEQIWFAANNPIEVQKTLLIDLLKTASRTDFGETYNFKSITTEKDFKEIVPVSDYEGLRPYIQRILQGEQNVLWPTEIKWFAKSSGTTSDKSKFIPVSFEALEESHFRGGRDVLSIYCHNFPETKIFEGKGLLIGGSHEVSRFSSDAFCGDLSAVMMNNMPYWSTLLSTPKPEIALLSNWDEKLEKMAEATMNEDVRSISGVPTWTLVLIKRMLEMKQVHDLRDIWPNIELFIHGGVSFAPYKEQFSHLINSSSMNYLESYNASEGFLAIQDMPDRDDLLLMMDYGIYYEFIPISEIDLPFPKSLGLEEVALHTPYAIAITTNAGLWRYLIGDTIIFTSTIPFRIKITGRTKSFINAFGEELMVYNSDYAISKASQDTGAKVREYTAAPIFLTTDHKGGHEWMIEFEKEPDDIDRFSFLLDTYLKEVNSDYEAKRAGNLALAPPLIKVCPSNTFYKWLKSKEKLGGQHKVPRLNNHRRIVEEMQEILSNAN